MNRLARKVALVTGASKGIGASIAKAFAVEGASVVVNYATDKQSAGRVVAEICDKGGKAVAVQADVSKAADVRRLFADVTHHFGTLDILVNNAGVYGFAPIEQITEGMFHEHFNVNVLGLILVTQEAVKLFGTRGGTIINISSIAATRTPPGSLIYAATKSSVNAITRVLANELGPRKIRVNTISPGPVETEGVNAAGFLNDLTRKMTDRQTPLGRIADPGDIAPIAVFLASQEAGWLTGEILFASGGLR